MSAGPWLSRPKYNFLGLGSIEFKVIAVGPLFDMLDFGFAGILIIGRNYKEGHQLSLTALKIQTLRRFGCDCFNVGMPREIGI